MSSGLCCKSYLYNSLSQCQASYPLQKEVLIHVYSENDKFNGSQNFLLLLRSVFCNQYLPETLDLWFLAYFYCGYHTCMLAFCFYSSCWITMSQGLFNDQGKQCQTNYSIICILVNPLNINHIDIEWIHVTTAVLSWSSSNVCWRTLVNIPSGCFEILA